MTNTAISDQLDTLLDEAARSKMTLREALGFLVSREIAQFPFVRELDGFDFNAQPSLDQGRSGNSPPAAGLRTATRFCSSAHPTRERPIWAVALGREAIRQNYNVQFITAATLVATLANAHSDGSLDKQLAILSRPKLLIIDELGYLPSRPMPPTCSSNSCHGATRRDRS
ncbi:ATP-binding protein [Mesorhizobium sp. WSM3862]|uniref:ATP-binding protein n=1 Tax=Mesorhizobium sp. WSM3862 TaxID=632858 RepID=UPI001FDFBD28|nr:ATP-binding protein [Mesorhizobium sp. WSM3862]